MPKRICPVFCDNCGALALAQLDGKQLCSVCVFKTLENTSNMSLPKFKLKPVKTIEDQNVVFSTSNSSNSPLENVILS